MSRRIQHRTRGRLPRRQRETARTVRAVLIGLLVAPWAPAPVTYADVLHTERARKVVAAFLYNFGKFVEWPDWAFPDRDDALVIGVVGLDPLGPILDQTVKGKQVQGRSILVERFDWFDPEDRAALRHVHLLFIAPSATAYVQEILDFVRHEPVLTVSVIPGFSSQGGMIELFLEDGKMRFSINRRAVERQGLRARAELLRLAQDR